jgi:hypothetical protein
VNKSVRKEDVYNRQKDLGKIPDQMINLGPAPTPPPAESPRPACTKNSARGRAQRRPPHGLFLLPRQHRWRVTRASSQSSRQALDSRRSCPDALILFTVVLCCPVTVSGRIRGVVDSLISRAVLQTSVTCVMPLLSRAHVRPRIAIPLSRSAPPGIPVFPTLS